MEVKKWHIGVFVGSIAVLVIYLQRNVIKRGYDYFSRKVTGFASSWIGVNEIGNNQAFGNQVFQQMMASVGWHSTDQWCMYFAKAVHYDAYKDNPNEQKKINTPPLPLKTDKPTCDTSKSCEMVPKFSSMSSM